MLVELAKNSRRYEVLTKNTYKNTVLKESQIAAMEEFLDNMTKITKRETIEGELGRFMLNQGEDPQAMYNWLKTLVNQVRNLGSSKWDDHEMVKVILGSLVFLNPTQVQLIRGDPRYKLMSLEEVIGKFVSFELMIKGSKKIIEQDGPSTPEAQPVTFKATEEKKEGPTGQFCRNRFHSRHCSRGHGARSADCTGRQSPAR